MIKKGDEGEVETRKSYETFKYWKDQGNEKEAEFHWMSYQTWSDEKQRLGAEIQNKLKAVQKFESPKK